MNALRHRTGRLTLSLPERRATHWCDLLFTARGTYMMPLAVDFVTETSWHRSQFVSRFRFRLSRRALSLQDAACVELRSLQPDALLQPHALYVQDSACVQTLHMNVDSMRAH